MNIECCQNDPVFYNVLLHLADFSEFKENIKPYLQPLPILMEKCSTNDFVENNAK